VSTEERIRLKQREAELLKRISRLKQAMNETRELETLANKGQLFKKAQEELRRVQERPSVERDAMVAEARKAMKRDPVRCPVRAWVCAVFLFYLSGPLGSSHYGQEFEGLSREFEPEILRAMSRGNIPSAAVALVYNDRLIWAGAYGYSNAWARTPAFTETVYLIGSTFKTMSTFALLQQMEQGKFKLDDPVNAYLTDFKIQGDLPSNPVTFRHLLTHTSGLPPYTDPKEVERLYGNPCPTETLVKHIAGLRKESPPGAVFTYSCLNYITLASIVKSVTGKNLAEFADENIFRPLGMKRTFFVPPADRVDLCVPTQVYEGKPLRGVVHDPLARLQGGVSGNAGLFSTADDLAVFAQMMLDGGALGKVRILGPLAVERMTEIFPKAGPAGRGLGWDLDSDYASVRGDLFGPASYGHSGYTGTSVWIDPETRTAVIFLTNRVHPDDKADIIAMRSKVANVVAGSILVK